MKTAPRSSKRAKPASVLLPETVQIVVTELVHRDGDDQFRLLRYGRARNDKRAKEKSGNEFLHEDGSARECPNRHETPSMIISSDAAALSRVLCLLRRVSPE